MSNEIVGPVLYIVADANREEAVAPCTVPEGASFMVTARGYQDVLQPLITKLQMRDTLLQEISNWLVCEAIATPADMAQSFSPFRQAIDDLLQRDTIAAQAETNQLRTISTEEKQLLSGVANGLGITYEQMARDYGIAASAPDDPHPFTQELNLVTKHGGKVSLEFDPADGQIMWLYHEIEDDNGHVDESLIRIDTIENAEAIAQHLLGWVRAERARRVVAAPGVCKTCGDKVGHEDDAPDQCRFCNAGKPSDEANTRGASPNLTAQDLADLRSEGMEP